MDLSALIRPRDQKFQSELTLVWQERADLQAAYPDATGAGLIHWAAVNGPVEYPERLGGFYPPVPPQGLLTDIGGGDTPHQHLLTSVENLATVARLWSTFADRPFHTIESVLDFGCGPGRVARWLPVAIPGGSVVGCDVRRAPIDWCAEYLTGRFFCSEQSPPLPLPDDAVDLVYALSVFSHLHPTSGAAWIRELARVCRPGGLILVTAFGGFALYVMAHSEARGSAAGLSPEEARDLLRRLSAHRVLFHAVTGKRLEVLGEVESVYGQTFLTAEHFAADWSDAVELLGHVPASYSSLQDFFVLRPR
ncbi:MAG: class I SAM-dependent methyltransferase [Planctomycetota bacterium]